jgi:hypothetical protein
VDAERLPGMVMAVAKQGQIVYHESIGKQDVTNGKAMEKDAININELPAPLFVASLLALRPFQIFLHPLFWLYTWPRRRG